MQAELTGQVATRYGRVTQARIDRFTAECFRREWAPPLGALVAVEDGPMPIYAAVSGAWTEGVDPGRRVASHGEPDDDLERVLADHPHVPALLQTSFEAIVVGHHADGAVRRYLPPAPAPILARVRACAASEIETLTDSFDFLKPLLACGPLADDVIAAALRGAAAERMDGRAFLVRAGKALAPWLVNDPSRLQAVLRRLQP
jgi:hypothetical protein